MHWHGSLWIHDYAVGSRLTFQQRLLSRLMAPAMSLHTKKGPFDWSPRVCEESEDSVLGITRAGGNGNRYSFRLLRPLQGLWARGSRQGHWIGNVLAGLEKRLSK